MDEQTSLAQALLAGLPDADELIEIMRRRQDDFLRENAPEAIMPDQRRAPSESD